MDGNWGGDFWKGSVSHTEIQLNAWWEVDLQGNHAINQIVLYNRTDCCGERLNNATVVVFDANRKEVWRSRIGKASRANPIELRTTGRYVRVFVAGRNYLQLAEVVVYGRRVAASPAAANVARGKPARQSTSAFGGLPSRAVDGNSNGNWAMGSVTHTALQQEAWWEVDLDQPFAINRVVLYNRTDCCSNRLNNVAVILYDANHRRIAHRRIVSANRVNTVNFGGTRGRFVRVQLLGKNYLSLAEVEVFGGGAAMSPIEYNTNRPGSDYNSWSQQKSNVRNCMAACASDRRCKAWTWVRPGVQGSQARCWVKNAVPAPRKQNCCASGVKR